MLRVLEEPEDFGITGTMSATVKREILTLITAAPNQRPAPFSARAVEQRVRRERVKQKSGTYVQSVFQAVAVADPPQVPAATRTSRAEEQV